MWGAAYGAFRGANGRQNLRAGLTLEVGDFGFDLGTEFVAGALEFVEGFPDLAADFGQLPGPEDEQGEQEQLWASDFPASGSRRPAYSFRSIAGQDLGILEGEAVRSLVIEFPVNSCIESGFCACYTAG